MASVGLSTVNLANAILNHLTKQAAWTQPAGLYAKLHVGIPGAAGTTNPGAVTTRPAASFAAASGGSIALTGTSPSWSMTTSETISHISIWDANSAGSFLWSAALSASKTVGNGDTLTLQSCGLSFSTLAAD